MSSEAEPEQSAEQAAGDDVPPVPDTPPVDEEDVPPPDPEVPPAPELPPSGIVFEPGMYYAVESVCVTENRGNDTPCPNLNTTTVEPMVYSNAGVVVMICGLCGKQRPILSATKLDPQPEVS